MYILNIASAIKRCQSLKSEALSLKTVINKLSFLKKTVIFSEKKDFLLLTIKQFTITHTNTSVFNI